MSGELKRRRRGRRGRRGRSGRPASQGAPAQAAAENGNGNSGPAENPIPIEAIVADDHDPVLELLPEQPEAEGLAPPVEAIEVEAELDEPEPNRAQKRRLKNAGPERMI